MHDRKFELRSLTESIHQIYEHMKLLERFPHLKKNYADLTEVYEKLWKKRDELEDEIFGK